MNQHRFMNKKRMTPTKRKRLKDKQSADLLTIQLLALIDELHKHKDSVSVGDLIKKLNNENNGHN